MTSPAGYLQQTPAEPSPTPGNETTVSGAFQEALEDTIVSLFESILSRLVGILADLFVTYPDVTESWVLEVHSKVFMLTIIVATAAIAWIGINQMLNRIDGVRYSVYILAALGVGAVAPDLLQYPVQLSEAATQALLPSNPGLEPLGEFTFQMAIVALLDVFVLLGIAIVFLGRNMYLLLGVALAPLLAIMMVTPGFRQYAQMLVSVWVACLIIGPLNAVLLDLLLHMLAADTTIYTWLWSLAGLVMLLGLPLTILSSGVVMLGPGLSLMRNTSGRFRRLGGRARGWFKQFRSSDKQQRGRVPRSDRSSGRDRGGDRGNRFDWRDR